MALYNYLLIVRFALVNIIAAGLLAAAWMQGWLDGVLTAHLVELSILIFFVFLYGLVLCGFKVFRHSVELNAIKDNAPHPESRAGRYLAEISGAAADSRNLLASALRLKLTDNIVAVRQVANSLVLLGLIGTVIGFIIALSGVDPDKAGDFNAVAPMVSTLIEGMSTALFTTLVGAVLNVWLMVNYHLLAGGTVNEITVEICAACHPFYTGQQKFVVAPR